MNQNTQNIFDRSKVQKVKDLFSQVSSEKENIKVNETLKSGLRFISRDCLKSGETLEKKFPQKKLQAGSNVGINQSDVDRRKIFSLNDVDVTSLKKSESTAVFSEKYSELQAKFAKTRFPVFDDAYVTRRKYNEEVTVNKDISSSRSRIICSKTVVLSPGTIVPAIEEPDVSKIKEDHKMCIYKPVRVLGIDTLPPDLIYNLTYIKEYLEFQSNKSFESKLSATFLKTKITPEQRSLIIKYLIYVSAKLKYPSYILYQAVRIFDFYIDKVNVELAELQLSSLASLWIALKKDYLFNDMPMASTIMKLWDKHYEGDSKPLFTCEMKILKGLNFEISYADPFSMLALYTVITNSDKDLEIFKINELYYFGSYVIDIALLYDRMCGVPEISLALLSAEIALTLHSTCDEDLKDPPWKQWREKIRAINPPNDKCRLMDVTLDTLRHSLLRKIYLSKKADTDFHMVYKKYNSERYGKISKCVLSKVSAYFLNNSSTELPLY